MTESGIPLPVTAPPLSAPPAPSQAWHVDASSDNPDKVSPPALDQHALPNNPTTVASDNDVEASASATDDGPPARQDTPDVSPRHAFCPDDQNPLTLSTTEAMPQVVGGPVTSIPQHRDTAAQAPTIASQIAPAVVTLSKDAAGANEIVLHLAPDSLGTVKITLSRDADGNTTVAFAAPRPETLHALASQITQLRAMVHEAGMTASGHAVHVTFRTEPVAAPAAVDQGHDPSLFSESRQQRHQQGPDQSDHVNASVISEADISAGSDQRGRREPTRQPAPGDDNASPAPSMQLKARDVLADKSFRAPGSPLRSVAFRPVNITV